MAQSGCLQLGEADKSQSEGDDSSDGVDVLDAEGSEYEHYSPPLSSSPGKRRRLDASPSPTDCDGVRRMQEPRQSKSKQTTVRVYADTDNSGNFNPHAMHHRQKRARTRRGPSTLRPRQARPPLCSLPSTARITILIPKTDASKAKLAEFDFAFDAQQPLDGYNFRQRDQPKARMRSSDLVGHPAARGCWPCYFACEELNRGDGDEAAQSMLNCSLLHNEFGWPCEACKQANDPCLLIKSPVRKLTCIDCKRKKLDCSFSYTRNHNESCHQCTADGVQCVAGPAKEFIHQRIRYSASGGTLPPASARKLDKKRNKQRTTETCRECCAAGRDCTYSPDAPSLACEACLLRQLPCTQLGAPEQPSASTASKVVPARSNRFANGRSATMQEQIAQKRDSASVLPRTVAPTVNVGVVQTTKIIETRYAHPILLNCDSASNGRQACLFHLHAGMAFFGLGKRTVQVQDLGDDRPLLEQWTSRGPNQTTICMRCTARRLALLQCPKHTIEPISGVDPSAEDSKAAVLPIYTSERKVDTSTYCSICCSLAGYECVSPECHHPVLSSRGCGLKLCGRCNLNLTLHDGEFEALLEAVMLTWPADHALRPRADLELLRRGGALERHVRRIENQSALQAR